MTPFSFEGYAMRGLQTNATGEQVAGQESAPAVSDSPAKSSNDSAMPCLALRPKEAAKALGIGERLLWSKTNAGEIPHIKLGTATLYPIDALREWLHQESEKRARR